MNNFFQNPFNDSRSDNSSFLEHNSQYQQVDIQKEILRQSNNDKMLTQYTDNEPLGLALDKAGDIDVAIDIGCGTGWATNLISKTKKVVYGIEPSLSAINIAKKIHSSNDKIIWIVGFAQTELKKISLKEPAFFNSLCVMSHLKDSVVSEICKEINRIALPGSILSFSECYGCDYDDGNLWHCREENWWQAQFPSWKFNFCGKIINHPQGAKKNFIVTKNI